MSDPMEHDLDRRQFITGGAAAGVAAAVAGAAQAGSQLELWDSVPRTSVVLHDACIPIPADIQRHLDVNGARVVSLVGDPVWFWRSATGAPLRDPGTTLLGVTGWADLLIFRGLAAETRRHLRFEKHDTASGTFIWMIA